MEEITQIIKVIDKFLSDPKIIDAVSEGRVRLEISHKLVDPRDWRSIRPFVTVEPTNSHYK